MSAVNNRVSDATEGKNRRYFEPALPHTTDFKAFVSIEPGQRNAH
jgi:hypothetical protein